MAFWTNVLQHKDKDCLHNGSNSLWLTCTKLVILEVVNYFLSFFFFFIIHIYKEERQNMVEILMSDTELRQTLIENYLKRVPDLQKIEWRFIRRKLTCKYKRSFIKVRPFEKKKRLMWVISLWKDCYKVYLAIETLPQMFELMLKHEGKNAHLIKEMFINPLNVIAKF